MMKGNPSWWDMNNPRPIPLQTSHPLISPPSLTSSSPFSQYPHPSNLLPMTTWNDTQELPESWSQLLLGGFGEEEDRCCFSSFQPKRMENWNDVVDIKQEISEGGYVYSHMKEEWTRTVQTASPSSCVTGLNSNLFDFSSSKAERSNHQLDHSSECNSTATGSAVKKARTQASSTQLTFKARKEKLGDRITALHQLVSPYGKTDTASVLLEAIGYIRFLQSQIEVLSSPYLGCGSGSVRQSVREPLISVHGERSCIFPEDPGQLLNDINMKIGGPSDQVGDDEPKDLRRKGLCLVPVSFMLHVGSDNGADYWAPNYGGVF